MTHYWWETPYQDGANGFRQGGLVVLTNLDLDTSPCILRSSTYTTGGIMFSGKSVYMHLGLLQILKYPGIRLCMI